MAEVAGKAPSARFPRVADRSRSCRSAQRSSRALFSDLCASRAQRPTMSLSADALSRALAARRRRVHRASHRNGLWARRRRREPGSDPESLRAQGPTRRPSSHPSPRGGRLDGTVCPRHPRPSIRPRRALLARPPHLGARARRGRSPGGHRRTGHGRAAHARPCARARGVAPIRPSPGRAIGQPFRRPPAPPAPSTCARPSRPHRPRRRAVPARHREHDPRSEPRAHPSFSVPAPFRATPSRPSSASCPSPPRCRVRAFPVAFPATTRPRRPFGSSLAKPSRARRGEASSSPSGRCPRAYLVSPCRTIPARTPSDSTPPCASSTAPARPRSWSSCRRTNPPGKPSRIVCAARPRRRIGHHEPSPRKRSADDAHPAAAWPSCLGESRPSRSRRPPHRRAARCGQPALGVRDTRAREAANLEAGAPRRAPP